ncbi:MAG: hypothetical protein ABSC25_08460 [Roseiarcus sp.]
MHGAGVAAVGFRVGACDAALAPRPLPEIAADNFFPIIRIRAMLNRERLRRRRRAARRGRDDAKNGENAIPARLTDNPLISLETAKEKVWKSLEKFGISLEFLWKSLEILGKAWKNLGSRRHDAQPQWAGIGWRAKPSLRDEAAENFLANS